MKTVPAEVVQQFAHKFGATTTASAQTVLDWAHRNTPDYVGSTLFSYVMQNRAHYMMGEAYWQRALPAHKGRLTRGASDKLYATAGGQFTADVLEFLELHGFGPSGVEKVKT